MEVLVMRVKAKLIDKSILGSLPSSDEIYKEFIASKAPEGKDLTEQIEAMGATEVEEKGTTVFPRDPNGEPCLFDYHILGFMKEAMGRLRENKKTACSKITSYKKKLDGNVFISPICITFHGYGEVGINQRPLRGQTPRGEIVALASSEEIKEGATFEFTIKCQIPEMEQALLECLAYGRYKGLGQWRNSGHGRFECTEVVIEKSKSYLAESIPVKRA